MLINIYLLAVRNKARKRIQCDGQLEGSVQLPNK